MTLEGVCPKCGCKWCGWGLLRDPYCSECGTLLEIGRVGEKVIELGSSEAKKGSTAKGITTEKSNAGREKTSGK
jgi:hypothetical protein